MLLHRELGKGERSDTGRPTSGNHPLSHCATVPVSVTVRQTASRDCWKDEDDDKIYT